MKVARPRVRDRAGKEVSLESWQALRDGNLLLEWALNLMPRRGRREGGCWVRRAVPGKTGGTTEVTRDG